MSQPEMDDARVRDATGRGWDEWCDLLDVWPGRDDGHAGIAAHVAEAHGVDGWWAQAVTVGYERITGRRLPNQRADGTFTASASRTVDVDPDALRADLLDDARRAALLPDVTTTLRSRPTAKSVRLGVADGIVLIGLEPRPDGRVRVTVAHERLASPADVERWRGHWSAWLDELAGA